MLCACVAGILHTGDEDRRRRERGGELGDERDRPTHAHVHRFTAPGRPERGAGGLVDRACGVDRVRLPDVAGGDGDLRTPGRVALQVRAQRVEMRAGVSAGSHPQAHLRAGPRDQRVRRLRNRCGVDADDGDRRLGPKSLHHRAGADFADAVEQAGLGADPLGGVVHVRPRYPDAGPPPRHCRRRRAGSPAAAPTPTARRAPRRPTARNADRGRAWRPRPRSRPVRAATPSTRGSRCSSCPSRRSRSRRRPVRPGERPAVDSTRATRTPPRPRRRPSHPPAACRRTPASPPDALRYRPCRRRCRARRAGHRVRWARTAPSATGCDRLPAARRGGRRAARSGHRAGQDGGR